MGTTAESHESATWACKACGQVMTVTGIDSLKHSLAPTKSTSAVTEPNGDVTSSDRDQYAGRLSSDSNSQPSNPQSPKAGRRNSQGGLLGPLFSRHPAARQAATGSNQSSRLDESFVVLPGSAASVYNPSSSGYLPRGNHGPTDQQFPSSLDLPGIEESSDQEATAKKRSGEHALLSSMELPFADSAIEDGEEGRDFFPQPAEASLAEAAAAAVAENPASPARTTGNFQVPAASTASPERSEGCSSATEGSAGSSGASGDERATARRKGESATACLADAAGDKGETGGGERGEERGAEAATSVADRTGKGGIDAGGGGGGVGEEEEGGAGTLFKEVQILERVWAMVKEKTEVRKLPAACSGMGETPPEGFIFIPALYGRNGSWMEGVEWGSGTCS